MTNRLILVRTNATVRVLYQIIKNISFFEPGTGLVSLLSLLLLLLLLLLFLLLLERPYSKKLTAPSFQIGSGLNLAGLFLKQTRIGVILGGHNELFHTEKCCHLVNAHTASVWRIICSSVRQFLTHSTFVLV